MNYGLQVDSVCWEDSNLSTPKYGASAVTQQFLWYIVALNSVNVFIDKKCLLQMNDLLILI